MTRAELVELLDQRDQLLLRALSQRLVQTQGVVNFLGESVVTLQAARWVFLKLLEEVASGDLPIPMTLDSFRTRGMQLAQEYEQQQRELTLRDQQRQKAAAPAESLVDVVSEGQPGQVDVGS